MGLLLMLRDLVIAIGDTIFGHKRRRYEHAVLIKAPRELVWRMLRAREIVFEGLIPLHVRTQPVPGRPGFEAIQIAAGETEVAMLTRIADERAGVAILYEIVPEGTESALIEGHDDYIGFVLADVEGGVRLDMMRETTPSRWISRLTVPLGLRSGGRRYKRKAEAMAKAEGLRETSSG